MTEDNPRILLYGATGYTAQLIIEEAKKQDIPLILAGRDENKLIELAAIHNMPYRAFSLIDKDSIDQNIKDVQVILHCAGPFSDTAEPMVKACLRKGVHYVDITGEISVFEDIAKKDAKAKKKGIILMPGAGFDVVPTDCMAGFLFEKMPDATSLELAFGGSSALSRGTATTMLKNIPKGAYNRINGKLTAQKLGAINKEITFRDKTRLCAAISWGDIATSFIQTKIPNITVYTAVNQKTLKNLKRLNYIKGLFKKVWIQRILKNYINKNIKGPDEQMRAKGRTQIWGKVSNDKGAQIEAWLSTPEAYRLTACTALEAAVRIGSGLIYPGYKTPAQAFGYEFINFFEGVETFEIVNK